MNVWASGIGSSWVTPVFLDFCSSEVLGLNVDGRVAARVDRAARFFGAVAAAFHSAASVDETALRSLFGAEGLRRTEKAATYLRRALSLAWRPVAVLVPPASMAIPTAGIPVLRAAYGRHLRSRLASLELVARTVLAYEHASDRLLDIVEADHAEVPASDHLRRLLWRYPGLRASLGPFLTWISAERAVELVMPRKAPRNLKRAELRLIDEVSASLGQARSSTSIRCRRAMVAFLTSKLLAMPIERVLALKWSDVRHGEAVHLGFEGEFVELPAALAVLYASEGRESGRFVFEGRNQWAPLSIGAVAYHVRTRPALGGGAHPVARDLGDGPDHCDSSA